MLAREYYFNDHGAQIDRFAYSLIAAAKGLPTPEDGYGGQYIQDIAAKVMENYIAEKGDSPLEIEDENCLLETFRSRGGRLMFSDIKAAFTRFWCSI